MTARDGQRRGARSGEEGVALILALVFVVLLTVLVVSYLYETQVDASVVGNMGVEFQCLLAAKSGVADALKLLSEDLIEEQASGGEPPFDDAKLDVWYITEDEPARLAPVKVNEALAVVFIDDEYGKLNLNTLIRDDGEVNRPVADVLRFLLESRTDQEVSVDAIIDWIDADSEPTGQYGAEYDYYEGQGLPYTSKDGPFDSVEELLLVAGITPEIFYGRFEDQSGRRFAPLTDLLTVHGHPNGAVNLNTAREDLVQAILWQRDLPESLVESIMDRQNNDPFRSAEDLEHFGIVRRQQQGGQAPPSQVEELPLVTFSRVFRVYSYGVLGDAVQRIEAYVWRDKDPMNSDNTEFFRFLKWSVTR